MIHLLWHIVPCATIKSSHQQGGTKEREVPVINLLQPHSVICYSLTVCYATARHHLFIHLTCADPQSSSHGTSRYATLHTPGMQCYVDLHTSPRGVLDTIPLATVYCYCYCQRSHCYCNCLLLLRAAAGGGRPFPCCHAPAAPRHPNLLTGLAGMCGRSCATAAGPALVV